MQLLIETLASAKAGSQWTRADVEVPADATVGQLKKVLEAAVGVACHRQLLSLETQHLSDEAQPLVQCGVAPDSRLHLTDFTSLCPADAGAEPCRIPATEHRGISLRQLQDLFGYFRGRTDADGTVRGWYDNAPQSPTYRAKLQLEALNLYQAASWLVRPATSAWRCSYVELVATQPAEQVPSWFISHAWSEPVSRFIQCVEEHSRLRHLSETDAWWVCAYANNQHELGEDLAKDPRKTSFYRAMQISKGVLLILDEAATPFVRVWCCFEESVALSEDDGRSEHMLLDIATIHEGQAQLITDGATAEDLKKKQGSLFRNIEEYEMSVKAHREATFPLSLVLRALEMIDIQKASASEMIDKRRILNSIVGRSPEQLDELPLDDHPCYEEINSGLRAIFALAVLPGCAKQGLLNELRQIAEVMARDTAKRQALKFNFSDMVHFNDDQLMMVGSALPPKLQELSLHCTRCTSLTDRGASALGEQLPQALRFLKMSFHGVHELTDAGAAALVQRLPATLQDLRLAFGDCFKVSNESLTKLAQGLPQTLTKLSLGFESCEHVGDHGAVALGQNLAKTLRNLKVCFLGCHALGNAGLTVLGEGLPDGLEVLSLSLFACNQVSDAGVAALTRCLPSSLRALTLDFRACDVGEAGIATLAALLPRQLQKLDLSFNSRDSGTAVTLSAPEELHAWQKAHPDVKPIQGVRSRQAVQPMLRGSPAAHWKPAPRLPTSRPQGALQSSGISAASAPSRPAQNIQVPASRTSLGAAATLAARPKSQSRPGSRGSSLPNRRSGQGRARPA